MTSQKDKDPLLSEDILTPELKKQFDQFVSPTQTNPKSKQVSIINSFLKSISKSVAYFDYDQTRKIMRLLSYTDMNENVFKIPQIQTSSSMYDIVFIVSVVLTLYMPRRYFTKCVLGLTCVYLKTTLFDHMRTHALLKEYLRIKPNTQSSQEIRNVLQYYFRRKLKEQQNNSQREDIQELLKQMEAQTKDYFILKTKDYML